MSTEATVTELIEQFSAQIEIFNENKDVALTNKAAAGRMRKATGAMTKIGKDLRRESVALFK
jgi:hypothetical protein